MEPITIDDFADKKGQIFRICMEDASDLNLSLTSAETRLTQPNQGSSRVPFSLLFNGTQGVLCQQAIYRLRHESGWEVEMFLVPIAGNPDGTYTYQAIYS